jgi:hypothetical protein
MTPVGMPSNAPVDMSTGRSARNYRYELSADDRTKFDAALAAVRRIKVAFDDWIIVGHAIVAARKHADRVGGHQTFRNILIEQQMMPPLDKATISRLEKIMAHLDAVMNWRATLTEHQRLAWAAPTSVVNRCPALRPRPSSVPRKPTRLESAEGEKRALIIEVERYRRGNDFGFRKEDRPADVADGLTRVFSEHKQRALMLELVRRLGTKRQREAFGINEPCDGADKPWGHSP